MIASLFKLLEKTRHAREAIPTPPDLAAFRSATARNEAVTSAYEREANVLNDLVRSIKGPKPRRAASKRAQ